MFRLFQMERNFRFVRFAESESAVHQETEEASRIFVLDELSQVVDRIVNKEKEYERLNCISPKTAHREENQFLLCNTK